MIVQNGKTRCTTSPLKAGASSLQPANTQRSVSSSLPTNPSPKHNRQAKDFPDEHFFLTNAGNGSLPEPNKVMLNGGSVIISPLGKILAGPLRNAEGVLTAELALDDVARKKFDLDVVGHYARNDGRW